MRSPCSRTCRWLPTSTRRSVISLSALERRLGHRFRDPALATTALTHRSADPCHNERLEFLGDAILGFLIAELLFHRDPAAREGVLTRARASLVRKETLAEVARGLELGDALVLGAGERKSGGRDRDSILADALEALIGAVYLDAGLEQAREVVQRLYLSRLEALTDSVVEKDPKTSLQERLQRHRLALPIYEVHDVHSDAYAQTFTVECRVEQLALSTTARGASRRHAEQAAASRMLALFDEVDANGSLEPEPASE